MPITITPKTEQYPDLPYDKALVSLSIAPVVQGNNVEAALSLRVVPYRELPDGTIDTAESLAYTEAVGNVFERAQSDPALAAAAGAIYPAIQAFLTARGV